MTQTSPMPAKTKEYEFSFAVDVRSCGRADIVPVFLPFSGCPGHCVYCAQDRQTGAGGMSLAAILEEAQKRLEVLSGDGELAFYGGTFTALGSSERRICLEFLHLMRKRGFVRRARCSTRPDALPQGVLEELRSYGLSLIELGAQSFDSKVLALSRRGYDKKTAFQGCLAVLESGFDLGVQLLPGMPGSTPKTFLCDVETALSLKPTCLRFYPCLVPEGTTLAHWYRAGRYAPWSLEETVNTLGRALALAWAAGVPVIRLAVAPEAAFETSLLAGPRHSALGSMIQAEALLYTVKHLIQEQDGIPARLELPARCQGFFYGNKGAMRWRWEALGLGKGKVAFLPVERGRLILSL